MSVFIVQAVLFYLPSQCWKGQDAPYRLADTLNRIANRDAAIIIDTHPWFSNMLGMTSYYASGRYFGMFRQMK